MPDQILDAINGVDGYLALQFAVAAALLMLGRRLYWLFVGGVGFFVTEYLATQHLETLEEWLPLPLPLPLVLAVVAGLAGALFAIFLQKLAITIAGFTSAAFFAYLVAENIGLSTKNPQAAFVAALLVGVLGAIFSRTLFDWALILLSSLTGSWLLLNSFELEPMLYRVVLMIVAVAGISIQANMLHRDRGKRT